MRNKSVSCLSIFLCVILIALSFSACGKQPAAEKTEKPSSSKTESTAETADDTEVEAEQVVDITYDDDDIEYQTEYVVKSEKEVVRLSDMAEEQIDTCYFDFIGGRDVMPIFGFHGPMTFEYSALGEKNPTDISDEFMKLVADCGVNMLNYIGPDYNSNPTLSVKTLELGEKYNIGVLIKDSYISPESGDGDADLQTIGQRINEYMCYPACCGIYVRDEPGCTDYFPNAVHYSKFSDVLTKLSQLNVFGYTNLFPLTSKGASSAYTKYVDGFLDACPVKSLLYDKYPFATDDSLKYANDYFVNMSIIRKAAEGHNIPFWTYVQAGSQFSDAGEHIDTESYFPGEGSTNWLVSTSLAYGAKAIAYFPLMAPYWFSNASSTRFDFQRNGLISSWHTKTRWYYYAQKINKQIAAVDDVLMNSVNKGVLLSGEMCEEDFKDVDFVLEGTEWRELAGIEGDAMVGCFNYLGNSAFYVVNYNNQEAQKIKLYFSVNSKMRIVKNAKQMSVTTDNLTLNCAAGEGVLIVIE